MIFLLKKSYIIGVGLLMLNCFGQSRQNIWPTSIWIDNLTDKQVVCTIPKLQKKGFKIENFSLQPFKGSRFVSMETDEKFISPVLVKWKKDGREYSQQIILKLPAQIQKEPSKLQYVKFNFDHEKCFLSFVIYDQRFLFNEITVLEDGTPVNDDDLRKRNGFHLKQVPKNRTNKDNEEDKHYQTGWLVIPDLTIPNEDEYPQYFIDIDPICKKIYVKNKHDLDKLNESKRKNAVCNYGVLPFLKKNKLILTNEWNILLENKEEK